MGTAEFIPKCEKCNKYIKPDGSIQVNYDGLKDQPNATCKKCGRTKMLFLGFF
jgi:RNase P subunit RPR2